MLGLVKQGGTMGAAPQRRKGPGRGLGHDAGLAGGGNWCSLWPSLWEHLLCVGRVAETSCVLFIICFTLHKNRILICESC